MYMTIIRPVIFYGFKTRTLKKADEVRPESVINILYYKLQPKLNS